MGIRISGTVRFRSDHIMNYQSSPAGIASSNFLINFTRNSVTLSPFNWSWVNQELTSMCTCEETILILIQRICIESLLVESFSSLTISRAPRNTPDSMLLYLRFKQWSGSSTNSVNGFESKIRENSSAAALQFVTCGNIPRYVRNAPYKSIRQF